MGGMTSGLDVALHNGASKRGHWWWITRSLPTGWWPQLLATDHLRLQGVMFLTCEHTNRQRSCNPFWWTWVELNHPVQQILEAESVFTGTFRHCQTTHTEDKVRAS